MENAVNQPSALMPIFPMRSRHVSCRVISEVELESCFCCSAINVPLRIHDRVVNL